MSDGGFEMIVRIAEIVQRPVDSEEADYYDQIFDLISSLIPHRYVTLYLLDHSHRKIELAASRGKVIDLIEMVHFEYGRGFSAWVAHERKTVVLNNLHRSAQDGTGIVKSFVSIPMSLESELVGVLNLGHDIQDAFTGEMVDQLTVIASLLAGMIGRKMLSIRLKKRNQELVKTNRDLEDTRSELVAIREKAAIAATVVSLHHEINNPLMTIQSNLYLLQNEEQNAERKKRFEKINQQLERIQHAMEQLKSIENPCMEPYVEGSDTQIVRTKK